MRKKAAIFLRKNKLRFFLVVVATIVYSAMKVGLSVLAQIVIDFGVSGDIDKLKRGALQVGIYLVVLLVMGISSVRLKNSCLKRAVMNYKHFWLDKILRKSITEYRQNDGGAYISQMSNDVKIIETDYLQGSIVIINELITMVLIIVLMVSYSWPLFWASSVCFVLPAMISTVMSKRVENNLKALSKRSAHFINAIKDLVAGFPVIKTSGAEKNYLNVAKERSDSYDHEAYRKSNLEGYILTFSDFSTLLILAAILFFGTFLIAKMQLTIGALIAYLQLLSFATYPLEILPAAITKFRACSRIIVEDTDTKNSTDAQHKASFEGKIELQNVSFSYNDKDTALKNVNLTFEHGKSYALVGASGSGKTTLLKLLIKYNEDYEGSILFDDLQLKDLDFDAVCNLIATVHQEIFLFNATLRENICVFKEFPEAKLKSVISLSRLDEVVKANGLDFQCGENGSNLSGGERQRVAIARALIREVPILVMDEATSNLDNIVAYQIENQLLNIDGLTRIVVVHKYVESLLQQYDEIIVLDKGRVVEQGSFENLIQKKGYFYKLYKLFREEADNV